MRQINKGFSGPVQPVNGFQNRRPFVENNARKISFNGSYGTVDLNGNKINIKDWRETKKNGTWHEDDKIKVVSSSPFLNGTSIVETLSIRRKNNGSGDKLFVSMLVKEDYIEHLTIYCREEELKRDIESLKGMPHHQEVVEALGFKLS